MYTQNIPPDLPLSMASWILDPSTPLLDREADMSSTIRFLIPDLELPGMGGFLGPWIHNRKVK